MFDDDDDDERVRPPRSPLVVMTSQPIKSVYRSANISLRKADLAKESGDENEQLFQLESFVKTVRHTLREHPMYARRKDDPEAVALNKKLPEVKKSCSHAEEQYTKR